MATKWHVLLLAAACTSRPSGEIADRVILGGDVRTMDRARPRATALAIVGNKIAAVGSDAEIRSWIGPRTTVTQLQGETVTPGLVDAHAHLYGLGADMEYVSLRQATSAADAARIVAASPQATDPGWILGRGWDQNDWRDTAFPHRSALDQALPGRPILLRRIDGHASWVSSAALAAAGVTRATPDPDGGKIVRDAKGEPTGVLIDNAMTLVDRVVPAADAAALRRRILTGAQAAVAAGLTGVHEMGISPALAQIYDELGRDGALPVRVSAYVDAELRPDAAPTYAGSRFEMRGVKFFVDGALGSRGARLKADYADDPSNRGIWLLSPEALRAATADADADGWQIAVHAIGDAGNAAVIDAFTPLPTKAHRHRIEHVQILDVGDVARLAASGAVASMQPTHATSDMPWAEARVGTQRLAGAYAWRTLLEAGVPLAFGSDFPVEDVRPILGLYAAVTRQDVAGQPSGGWLPGQRLSLDEALAAFTTGAAFAVSHEDTRGQLRVGFLADVTIFAAALGDDTPAPTTVIAQTLVDGVPVYQR